jgi:hypothetical protein
MHSVNLKNIFKCKHFCKLQQASLQVVQSALKEEINALKLLMFTPYICNSCSRFESLGKILGQFVLISNHVPFGKCHVTIAILLCNITWLSLVQFTSDKRYQ